MNSNRIWTLSCVIVITALLAGGYLLGISPMLSAAAVAKQDRVAVEQQNLGYEQELATLKADFAKIDARRSELAAAQEIVPDVADDAAFVGELDGLQATSGAVITGFNVSDPKSYAPVVSALPVDPNAAPAEDGAVPAAAADGQVDGAATTTVDTVPAAVSTPAVPGVELVTAASFSAIPYTVSVAGTLEQTQAYVAGLQRATRLFLITKLTFLKDQTSGQFTADINGYIWVYKAGAAAAAAEAPDTALAAGVSAN